MSILKSDEIVLIQENVVYNYGRGFQVPGNRKGILTLTNKRLIFEYTEGLIVKSRFFGFDQSLDSIINTTTDGLIKKQLIIEFKPNSGQKIIGVPRISLNVPNIQNWKDGLNNAIRNYS